MVIHIGLDEASSVYIRIHTTVRTWRNELDTVYEHGDGRGYDEEEDEDDDEPSIGGSRLVDLVLLS